MAVARLKTCRYCGRIHPADYVCSSKSIRVKEPTEISRLRTCRRWDKTRTQTYERDHYLCRVCLARGRVNNIDLEAHHIIPLREAPNLAYELDNTITLCINHHKEAERGIINRKTLYDLLAVPFEVP